MVAQVCEQEADWLEMAWINVDDQLLWAPEVRAAFSLLSILIAGSSCTTTCLT